MSCFPTIPGPVVEAIPFLAFTPSAAITTPILAWIVLSFPGHRLESPRPLGSVAALDSSDARPGPPAARRDAARDRHRQFVDEAANPCSVADRDSSPTSTSARSSSVSPCRRRGRRCPPPASDPAGAAWATDPVLLGEFASWAVLAGRYTIGSVQHVQLDVDIVPCRRARLDRPVPAPEPRPLGLLLGAIRLRGDRAPSIGLLAGPDPAHRAAPAGAAFASDARRPDASSSSTAPPMAAGSTATDDAVAIPVADAEPATTLLEATGQRRRDRPRCDPARRPRPRPDRGRRRRPGRRQRATSGGPAGPARGGPASRARIVEAGDAERRRVERDLHDGAQQRLVALAVSLRTIRTRLGSGAAPAAPSSTRRRTL